MGYKKPADVPSIISQIRQIANECRSPYNDGFVAFDMKKDLWQIKEILTELLDDLPKFEGEEEWLTKREKERIVNYLKK
jgi:hypothetical protein